MIVYGVVDYYCVVNFEIVNLLYMCLELVGLVLLIVYCMFKENGVLVFKELVGLLLLGLILDIFFLKLLIIYVLDILVVKELVEFVGVNLEEYGLEMFKVGINFLSKIVVELIDIDVKIFELNGEVVCVV